MRSSLLFSLLLILSLDLNAQKNFATGTWETYSSEYHTNELSGRIIVNALGEARWDHAEGFYLSKLKNERGNCTPNERSLNNYTTFTLSLAIDCAGSDTVETFNLMAFSVGSPFYMLGYNRHLTSIKENAGLDLNCFYEGSCSIKNYSSFLRKPSLRTVEDEKGHLFVGSSTDEEIYVEEIRFTETTTEILLLFSERADIYTGNLNPPGSENAFFLRDSKGNRYSLLSQMGWLGDEKGDYGSFSIPEETERHLILFFEPVKDPYTIKNLDLLEGICESGCWNFYDIRLKD